QRGRRRARTTGPRRGTRRRRRGRARRAPGGDGCACGSARRGDAPSSWGAASRSAVSAPCAATSRRGRALLLPERADPLDEEREEALGVDRHGDARVRLAAAAAEVNVRPAPAEAPGAVDLHARRTDLEQL